VAPGLSAHVAFVHALIRYRNATDEERRRIREERWAALAEIVLVAPPDVVAAASYQVATGERLLDPGLAPDARQAVCMEMWERNRAFTRLARTDLRVGAADPWEAVAPPSSANGSTSGPRLTATRIPSRPELSAIDDHTAFLAAPRDHSPVQPAVDLPGSSR